MSAHEVMIFVIKLQGVLPRHDYFYRITEPTVNNCVFSEFLSTAEELKVKGLSQSESDRENKAKKRSLPPPLKGMKSITTKAFLIQFHLDMSRLLCTLYKRCGSGFIFTGRTLDNQNLDPVFEPYQTFMNICTKLRT